MYGSYSYGKEKRYRCSGIPSVALFTCIFKRKENSLEDFQIEGETYVVCDKSDDAVKLKFSLKTQEGDKEFWGIDIAPELYEQIEYGSIVKFENGKYVLA